MYKTIAFIPVRGGSKSIPLKNIKDFCGKPLLFWVCQALEKSYKIDKIVIATDSEQIKKVAKAFPFKKIIIYDRDKENAQDNSSTESVMLEYVNKNILLNDWDNIVLVQATNPFLTHNDINQALVNYSNSMYDSMLSVIEKHFFTWNKKGKSINYNYKKRKRRQDIDDQFLENGSFYINKIGNLKKYKNRLHGKIGLYKMPFYSCVDIDSLDDWKFAEAIMKHYKLNKLDNAVNKKRIDYFFTDCDGVLTDGSLYYDSNGQEMKKFNTKDGMGLSLLKKAKYKVGIITGDKHKLIKQRFDDLNLDYLFLDSQYKLFEIQKFLNTADLSKVAYIGDDINDVELLKAVGLKACPCDANPKVKEIENIIILKSKGGQGCVREFIDDYLL